MPNSSELLRQYETWECLGDGYPQAWHSIRHHEDDGTGVIRYVETRMGIKHLIREQAGHRCLRCGHPYRAGDPAISERGEWSPCDQLVCSHGPPTRQRSEPRDEGNGIVLTVEWREAQWRILTVHHLDEDKANCRWWNLAALCQRCHLRMQRAVVMGRPYHFEHSEWFKPYAAGFYAFKYLDEDLTREETMARLDELLALELRFKQDALF